MEELAPRNVVRCVETLVMAKNQNKSVNGLVSAIGSGQGGKSGDVNQTPAKISPSTNAIAIESLTVNTKAEIVSTSEIDVHFTRIIVTR